MLTTGGSFVYQYLQNAAGATGGGTPIETTGGVNGACTALTMQVTGTFVGTVTFEGTVDATNWVSLLCTSVTAGSTATTATAPGVVRVDCSGLTQVRARVSAYTSGSITVIGLAVA